MAYPKHFPDFHLDIPGTVDLTCPECHSQVACDVAIEEIGLSYVAHAEIDADRCDACEAPLCPACPREKNLDGFDVCKACADYARTARQTRAMNQEGHRA